VCDCAYIYACSKCKLHDHIRAHIRARMHTSTLTNKQQHTARQTYMHALRKTCFQTSIHSCIHAYVCFVDMTHVYAGMSIVTELSDTHTDMHEKRHTNQQAVGQTNKRTCKKKYRHADIHTYIQIQACLSLQNYPPLL